MRIVAVDPGEVRVGLAISDESHTFAFPRETVPAGRDVSATVDAVVQALDETQVTALVVGLPLRLNGTEGDAARKARALGDAISSRLDVPVHYWDERLSTVAAERSLRELGVRGARRKEVIDQSAAAIVLQSYLDARAHRE